MSECFVLKNFVDLNIKMDNIINRLPKILRRKKGYNGSHERFHNRRPDSRPATRQSPNPGTRKDTQGARQAHQGARRPENFLKKG